MFKTVLITGASSGIGKALALKFAGEGYHILMVSRNREKLMEVQNEILSHGGKADVFVCDVMNREEVESVFRTILSKYGFIDIVILNSGTSERNPIHEFNLDKAITVLRTNIEGFLNCAAQLFPMYFKEKKGTLVGVSSLADSRGFPKSGVYSGSKAAMTKILESLRVELSLYNVDVLTVKPGFVKTPMTDKNEFFMPFMISPEKAAEIIYKGIVKKRRIISFPWQMTALVWLVRNIPDVIFEMFALKHLQQYSETLSKNN